MAEPSSILHPAKLPTPKLKTPSPRALLYKFIFFVVFVALLPLFPSQAPKFVGETIFTRVWELVHLLFVGIAVSYGLFSRRNVDPDVGKEPPQKDDSPRSFVSQMHHVSSVFDDDHDEVGSPHGGLDDSKIQTWSSHYYRNESAVLVANGGTNGSHATKKPLLLPVRSLKSRHQNSEPSEEVDEHFGSAYGIEECVDSRNGSKESVVLPSPIPWRSRSGRMEAKDDPGPGAGTASPPSRSTPRPPAFDAYRGLTRTPSFRQPTARESSTTPSPKRLSPSPSLSPEVRAKSSADMVKTKSIYVSTPPPAPPPPPPPPPAHLGHGYPSTSERKVTARSFKDELKDLSRRGREGWQGKNHTVEDPPPVSTAKPRSSTEGPSVGRSVRTVKAKEVQSAAMDGATKTASEQTQYFEARRPPPVPQYVPADDYGSDDDEVVEHSAKEEASISAPGGVGGADDNEVDKKADAFIARFREQIRLQRIESMKRSTKERSNRMPQ